ncbi:MAG: PQQ-dependent sugar dehydrogenase [Hyphomonadaceae bacterium]
MCTRTRHAFLAPGIFAPTFLALMACSPALQAEPDPAPQTPRAPVAQGEPNKRDAVPAFPGQTRAPESLSGVTFNTSIIADDLDEPWGLALLPGGGLLVTERTGKLWRFSANGQRNEVKGVPEVDKRGQGGLLDISLAPDFANRRLLYFSFSEPRGDRTNGTSLARATLSTDGTRLENVEIVFRQEPAWASPLHFGSNIEWDSAGNIFLTLGERSQPEPRKQAQQLDSLLGKVVHLKPDGTAVDANPFVGADGARPEIWSYGHRNVQGAAIHPLTGKLWTIEHGPRGGDELNIPEAGKNYGWPVITYGIDYPGGPIGEGITAHEGMEQPVYYWDPVIAPGDMTFYQGDLFPWKGDLLIAGLSGPIVRLEIEDDRVIAEERLDPDLGRMRDIVEAPDGSLYVITDDSDGVLARLTPST